MSPATAPWPSLIIRGEVLRTYEVRDVADVDWNLRKLKAWLAEAIEQTPTRTLEHIRKYNADVDKLLDARNEMGRSS